MVNSCYGLILRFMVAASSAAADRRHQLLPAGCTDLAVKFILDNDFVAMLISAGSAVASAPLSCVRNFPELL
jgi:hypothetical protein